MFRLGRFITMTLNFLSCAGSQILTQYDIFMRSEAIVLSKRIYLKLKIRVYSNETIKSFRFQLCYSITQ